MLPTVTGFAARRAIAALRKRGVPVDPLLHRVGLSERDLAGDDNSARVTAIALAKLLDLAAEATGDSAFGLHLAEQSDPRDAGIIFYVASGAENFGEALALFARYFRIVNEAVRLKLTRTEERLIAEAEFIGLPRHEVRQNAEFGIAAILKALREVAGRNIRPTRVAFAHARNSELREFERFLPLPCRVRPRRERGRIIRPAGVFRGHARRTAHHCRPEAAQRA
ncbi:MAG TPA: AraC family transcriptional regulator ligand-binding domain-containing protein [Roseiarcus sp.]